MLIAVLGPAHVAAPGEATGAGSLAPPSRARLSAELPRSATASTVSHGPLDSRADDVSAAATLYQRHCAVCHGAEGKGDGPAAGLLMPRPRDFTSGLYKFRSTPSGTPPTDADVVATVSNGLPGTSMPAFHDLLTRVAIESVARFVRSMAPPSVAAPPFDLGAPPPRTPAAEARGAARYARLGCGACHGADGRWRGGPPADEGPGATPRPADLSEPWAFRGGADPRAVALRVLTGLDGSSMPGYAGAVTVPEAWELAYHVATLARTPIWDERDPERIGAAGVARDPIERGRYLVNAMLCPLCHTPISPETGAYDSARFLAGGMRVSAYPWGAWYSRNLTPDAGSGLGRWSDDDIVRAVTRGVARDGRRLDPMAMPWPWFSRLTEADARAIAAYLRRVPPVVNAVPPPSRVSWPEAVGGKLLALAGAPVGVEFWGGNAATDASIVSAELATRGRRLAAALVGAVVLAVALVCLAMARRRRRFLLPGALLAMGWIALAAWPPLSLMSPDLTTRWLFAGTPRIPDDVTGAARALAERGAYVATIAPCGLCHTPASAFVGFATSRTLAGGMEARWRVFGSAVSTNLTAPAHGNGSDEALRRALASGIGQNGRAMHWQAMPWDISSRWSLEDQRALLAYLRTLPAVPGTAPPPRGPRPGDPVADTFYFGDAIRR
jgi:mono/diheme cytochrome c family protein